MRIKIDVTAEDIVNGVRGVAFACPIARAVKRMGSSQVYVAYGCLECDEGEGFLPKSASDFVDRFDEGLPVSPFSFEVEIEDAP